MGRGDRQATIEDSQPVDGCCTYKLNLGDSNYTCMKHCTNSFTSLANVWKAWQGLPYVDWNSNGSIDHTMHMVGVVVKKDGKADSVIDQKSNNCYQIPLIQSLNTLIATVITT